MTLPRPTTGQCTESFPALRWFERQRLLGAQADRIRAPGDPVVHQVVVVAAAWVARLARHVLPARGVRVAEVGQQAVGRPVDALEVAAVGDEADRVDGLVAAAGRAPAREQ